MADKNPVRFALQYVETILFEKSTEQRSRTEWRSQTVPGQTFDYLIKFSLLPLYKLHREQCGEYRVSILTLSAMIGFTHPRRVMILLK